MICIKWLAKPNDHREDPHIGAIWLENEGRYEYTQAYYDNREQSFILNRIKLKEQNKQRAQLLKDARPHLWKSKNVKIENTLDSFMKKIEAKDQNVII